MGAVGKGGTAEYGEKFAYHKIDDIDEALRGALVLHGVVCTVTKISDRKLEYYEKEDKWKNLKITWYAECLVTIELVNADVPSDKMEIVGWGQGLDSSDKATGKAISYAAKAAYLSAFHLRGQPDNEEDNHEAPPPKYAKPTDTASATKSVESKPAETKPAAAKQTTKATPPKVEPKKSLPKIENLAPEVQSWVKGCQQCDDIESLGMWLPGLEQESDEIKNALKPFVTEQKKICWSGEIERCATIQEWEDVGNRIAKDPNKELHNALHEIYRAKKKVLKEKEGS
jgi:hypothetical protein